MHRRIHLGLGLGLLVWSAADVSGASDGEVEGAAYGGTTAGGWICGPVGRANYGGVGANVRLSERPVRSEDGMGWYGNVGAGLEYETVQIRDCTHSDCNPDDTVSPPNAVMFGARLRGGYQWRSFGLEAGALVFQGWEDNTSTTPSPAALPEAEISLGPREQWRLMLGLGSPGVTTMRRPGAYGGADIVVGGGHRVDLRAGIFRQGPPLADDVGPRFDATWRAPLSDVTHLRAGGSVSSGDEEGTVGGEASLGFAAAF